MRALINEIERRYPLLREVCLSVSSSKETLPHLLGLLLSIAESHDERSCCFVLPSRQNIASTIAILLALVRFRREFDSLIHAYTKQDLKIGQRVRVLPSKHVYVYDGVFTDKPHLHRLRVQGTESSVRSFPINQSLRLEPTIRKRPKGKLKTELGDTELSGLDRLLGVQSGGNESLFKNRVLYLSSRSSFEHLLSEVQLYGLGNDGTQIPSRLVDIFPWGTISDDGGFVHSNRYQVRGEPLLALTHSVDHLAEACCRLNDQGSCDQAIIVDGPEYLIRNLQAFDDIVSTHRMLVVADDNAHKHVSFLEERGCLTWLASDTEILLGQTPEHATPSSFFRNIFKAVTNRKNLEIEVSRCADEWLDLAADGLILAGDTIGLMEGKEEAKQCVHRLFWLLFMASDRVTPLKGDAALEFTTVLDKVEKKLNRQALWLPPDPLNLLRDVVRALREAIRDENLGETKGAALLKALSINQPGSPHTEAENVAQLSGSEFTIDAASGVRSAVVTRYQKNATDVRSWLLEQCIDVPVTSDRLLPEDCDYDRLIILSWLNTDRFRNLIQRYAAPLHVLLSYPFEYTWVRQFKQRFSRQNRRNLLDTNFKTELSGMPENLFISQQNDKGDPLARRRSTKTFPPDDDLSIFTIEKKIIQRRKGTSSQSTSSETTSEARYVGFLGNTYTYLTAGHSLPVVTRLVRNPEASQGSVPHRTVKDLKPGDFVLFREGSNHDVVQLFAEDIMGYERYTAEWSIATSWREPLRSSGSDARDIYKQLRFCGLKRGYPTVRNWLYNNEQIGPQDAHDLHIIEQTVGTLPYPWSRIWEAIEEIRRYHTSAGFKVSEWLLREVPGKIDSLADGETCLDLDFGKIWVVEIEDIALETEMCPLSRLNRLLWEAF